MRAEVVTALVLGAGDRERGFPAVRLRVRGSAGRVDLMEAVITHALVLEYCSLGEQLQFVEATAKTARICSSYMLSFSGARMRVEGIASFHQSVIAGGCALTGCARRRRGLSARLPDRGRYRGGYRRRRLDRRWRPGYPQIPPEVDPGCHNGRGWVAR